MLFGMMKQYKVNGFLEFGNSGEDGIATQNESSVSKTATRPSQGYHTPMRRCYHNANLN